MSSWYYSIDGQQNGPVPLKDLVRLLGSGIVGPADLVWREGMTDWLPVAQVPELAVSPPAAEPKVIRPAGPGSGQPLNPYAAPASSWVPAAVASGSEIVPGSDPLDAVACIKHGFELTKRHLGLLIATGLVYGLLSIGFDIGTSEAISFATGGELETEGGLAAASHSPRQTLLISMHWAACSLVDLFLGLGLVRIGLNLVSGRDADISMLFGEGRKLASMTGASILYYSMVVVGLVLLVVPGIYLALRFSQYGVAIVDKDLGAIESLKYSARLTEGNKMNLLGLFLLGILVVLAGVLALVVGLLVALPVVYLGSYIAYRWMQYGRNATLG